MFSANHGVKARASSAHTFRTSTGESVPMPFTRHLLPVASNTSTTAPLVVSVTPMFRQRFLALVDDLPRLRV